MRTATLAARSGGFMQVRVLMHGLTVDDVMFAAGQVVDNPPRRLVELAELDADGELFCGRRAVEFFHPEPPEDQAEDELLWLSRLEDDSAPPAEPEPPADLTEEPAPPAEPEPPAEEADGLHEPVSGEEPVQELDLGRAGQHGAAGRSRRNR